MTQPLTAKAGNVFVQSDPNVAPEYLGCVDFDALADPRGAISLIRCRDANGDYVTVGEKQDAPDVVSTTITALTYPEFDLLDRIARCYLNLFVTQIDCGKNGQFGNWARADILHHAKLTTRTLTNAAMREATDETMRALEFTGWGVLHLTNKLKLNRQTIAETTNLNALAIDGSVVCAGDCGAGQDAGDVGWIGSDAPSGSPGGVGEVWQTVDGATWTTTVGGGTHPFAGTFDIHGAAIFDLDRSTKRWLAVRESAVGAPLQIAYSDNGGASWVRVTVGSVNAEGAAGAEAVFAIDRDHIWIATTEGNVYFSNDAAVTWTLQTGAAVESGGESLNAIKFADVDNGFAAGESDTLIVTNDGGGTWSTVTPPTSGANLTALLVFSPFHVLVGSNADGLFATFDAGAHWSSKTFSGQTGTGTIKALDGVGDLVVWMIRNPASGAGAIYRSIDGGNSWQIYTTPSNAGLNDIAVIDANNIFVVGNASGGTGVVIRVRD